MKTDRLIILVVVLLGFYANSLSQDSNIKNRLNFKMGFSNYKEAPYNPFEKVIPNYRFEASYGFFQAVELGAYIGWSKFDFYTRIVIDTAINYGLNNNYYESNSYFTPFYGFTINFHPLPLIIRKNDIRIDLYSTLKVGGQFNTVPSNSFFYGHFNEYGIGLGFAYYLNHHTGIFVEYCKGKYFYKDQDNLRYGLSFKF